MSFKDPKEMTAAGLEKGVAKAKLSWDKALVAGFLADQTGIASSELPLERLEQIALAKGVEETEWQIFLRAMGCNWLVCLAVMLALAAQDVAGKIIAIFFPIMAFVAMGFDHVVANMFFLPAAIFAGVDLTWWDALHNWIFAFLGNFVGAVIFVAAAYWYLYARPAPGEPTAGASPSPQRSPRPSRRRLRRRRRSVRRPAASRSPL
jgi:hypothetical protein